MKSQEILPLEDRLEALSAWETNDMTTIIEYFNKYHKALEAAELEIAELKTSKEEVDKIAKERYLKAYTFYKEHEYKIDNGGYPMIDEIDWSRSLKIATGLHN